MIHFQVITFWFATTVVMKSTRLSAASSGTCKRWTIHRKCCILPFRYRGKTFVDCTKERHDKLWCATGRIITKFSGWENCEDQTQGRPLSVSSISTSSTQTKETPTVLFYATELSKVDSTVHMQEVSTIHPTTTSYPVLLSGLLTSSVSADGPRGKSKRKGNPSNRKSLLAVIGTLFAVLSLILFLVAVNKIRKKQRSRTTKKKVQDKRSSQHTGNMNVAFEPRVVYDASESERPETAYLEPMETDQTSNAPVYDVLENTGQDQTVSSTDPIYNVLEPDVASTGSDPIRPSVCDREPVLKKDDKPLNIEQPLYSVFEQPAAQWSEQIMRKEILQNAIPEDGGEYPSHMHVLESGQSDCFPTEDDYEQLKPCNSFYESLTNNRKERKY